MTNDRLYFVGNADHWNNEQLGEYWTNSVIRYMHGPVDEGKQIIVNFVFSAAPINGNHVQIFVGDELVDTIAVNRNTMSHAVIVAGDGETDLVFFLRPVIEMQSFYFYYLNWMVI